MSDSLGPKTQSIKALADEHNTTAKYVLRVKEAVLKYYGNPDMTQEEIAEELGVRRPTVSKYLNSEVAKEFEAPFSARKEYEVRKEVEEKFKDLEDKTEQVVREVLTRGKFGERLRAIRELRQNHKELTTFLEKIGVLDTEPERHEVEHGGVPQVQIITGQDQNDTSGKPEETSGGSGD